ncbi:MAG: HAD-IIIA family hydrolase [Alphaproteobacteria bacterium]|nr:HAD-IIIA family hydrolase [Alphaproteobacteria bacterium]
MSGSTARAVFLDRDGVLNVARLEGETPVPPRSLADLKIIDGVPEALEKLRAAGFKLIVTTNQPDVARGILKNEVLESIHAEMRRLLSLDAIEACIHDDADGCACRKPRPGMIRNAAARFNVNLAASFMVGDRWRDIDAGIAAGCRTILVGPGYKEGLRSEPDFRYSSLAEAAEAIIHLPV